MTLALPKMPASAPKLFMLFRPVELKLTVVKDTVVMVLGLVVVVILTAEVEMEDH